MPNAIINNETWNQLRHGDPQALLHLYNEYYVGLINFGTRVTGNRELTNDCISEVLIKLWNKHENLPDVKNIRSYLITSLKNELLSELKKADKIRCGNDNYDNETSRDETSYEEYLVQTQTNADIKNNINRAFSRLSKREKQLLEMKFFEDLSYGEIALACHITKRTAYNIIHTALNNIKADFKKEKTPFLSFNNLASVSLIIFSVCNHILTAFCSRN